MADLLQQLARQALAHSQVCHQHITCWLPTRALHNDHLPLTSLLLLPLLLPLLLQLDNAVQLLLQASSQQPLNPNVWFTLATALARKVRSNQGTSHVSGYKCINLLGMGRTEAMR